MFRRDQSDFDGSFVLRGVVPGSYTIVGVEDAWGFREERGPSYDTCANGVLGSVKMRFWAICRLTGRYPGYMGRISPEKSASLQRLVGHCWRVYRDQSGGFVNATAFAHGPSIGDLASEKYGANSPLHKIRSHMAGSTVPAGPTLNPPNLSQKEDSTVRLGLSPMDSSSRPFHLASSPSSNDPSSL
jgi:hypothetical protein